MTAQWDLANYMAVVKLGYNDHGPIHAQIVTASAMQMTQLLHHAGVDFDVVESGAGDLDDAHAVVLAGIMLHDIGNQIHRVGHEAFSVALAQPILERHFAPVYGDDPIKLQALLGFTLSAIACHDCDPAPLTMEGAVVAVADATDMTKGRGRIAFDLGKIDIHSVSALAIESVTIQAGGDRTDRDCGGPQQFGGHLSGRSNPRPQVDRHAVERLRDHSRHRRRRLSGVGSTHHSQRDL